jgi:hypothetical protein
MLSAIAFCSASSSSYLAAECPPLSIEDIELWALLEPKVDDDGKQVAEVVNPGPSRSTHAYASTWRSDASLLLLYLDHVEIIRPR